MLIYATLMLFCLDGPLPRKYHVAAMENKPVTTLDPDALRSAMRGYFMSDDGNGNLGFRLSLGHMSSSQV